MTIGKNLGTVNSEPEVAGSRTQQMLDALKGGATLSAGPDSPSVGLDSEPEQDVQEEMSLETNVETEDSEVESEVSLKTEKDDDEESESEVSLKDPKEESPARETKLDISEINITDDKGKRKVKVDFSDKEKLTKFVQLAYGARKWQKERDDLQKQLDEKVQLWDKFEGAWKQGYRGLINTLEGSNDAFDKFVEAEITRRQELEDMSPIERKALEVEERFKKQQFEADKLKSDYENKLKEITQKEQAAAQKELESRIHPAFERYRFSGKLGDSVAEHEFDTMLWERTLARLEGLPDDSKITQAIVDREFRSVSQMMSKHINAQAEKEVKKAMDKKKIVATQQVQAAAKRGVVKKQDKESVTASLRSGNIVDGLAEFFKSGGKFR